MKKLVYILALVLLMIFSSCEKFAEICNSVFGYDDFLRVHEVLGEWVVYGGYATMIVTEIPVSVSDEVVVIGGKNYNLRDIKVGDEFVYDIFEKGDTSSIIYDCGIHDIDIVVSWETKFNFELEVVHITKNLSSEPTSYRLGERDNKLATGEINYDIMFDESKRLITLLGVTKSEGYMGLRIENPTTWDAAKPAEFFPNHNDVRESGFTFKYGVVLTLKRP